MNVLLLLAALVAQDTAVVVQGVLLQVPASAGGEWLVALPTPFRFHDRNITELPVARDNKRWEKFQNRYVEAHGRLQSTGALRVDEMREVEPEGTVRKTTRTSFSHRIVLVLWVLPQHFRWRDAAGRPTGVTPSIIYTMNNHGESALTLRFATNDFVCFSVEPVDGGTPAWHFATHLQEKNEARTVTMSPFVREVTPIPLDAAALPGRYRVRAGLCGFTDYQLETEIEVLR